MKRALAILALSCAPGVVSGQTPQIGTPAFGSYQSFGLGVVDLQNLNLNLTVPLMTSPGRAMNLGFGISYNGLIWQRSGTIWTPVVDPGGAPTWGWNLNSVVGTFPYQYTTSTCFTVPGGHPQTVTSYSSYYYVEPNGTHHPFSVYYTYIPSGCPGAGTFGSNTGYATDNSGFYINITNHTSPIVYSPSGMKITNGTITDTNGNSITSMVVNSSETDWTDTAGRTALKIITGSSTVQYQVFDPNGNYQTITVTLSSQNIQTSFGCSGITEYTGTANLPSAISFPNGQGYSFTYESTGTNVTSGRARVITIAGGGQYLLTYSGAPNDGVNCADGTATYLDVIPSHGAPPGEWTFTRAQNGSNWQTTASMPDPYTSPYLDQALYTFNSSGQETSRLIYQGQIAGGTLLREIDTTWASNGTPQSKILVLDDGTTASETDTTFDTFGNLDGVSEYDWGTKTTKGNLIRTTTLTYLNSSAYTSRNILNRVLTKIVANGSGTQYREDIAYDGSSLSPCPTGAVQHDDTNYGCSFTTRGLPTSSTTYTSPANQTGGVTKNFTYDSLGNLRTAQVNCCQQKQWNFSSTTQYAFPDSIVSGSGTPSLTTSYTYNTFTGQVVTSTDENNQVTSATFDVFGRPLTLTRPDTTVITYSYNDTANTNSVSVPVAGSTKRVQQTTLDTLGRPSAIALMDASGTTYATSETTYDSFGRVRQTSTPHNGGTQAWTTRQYDVLGRPTVVTLPDGSQTTYTYATNTVTVTDPAGKKRKTQVDAAGRVVTAFEPDSSNNLTQQTTFTYNVLDELLGVSQGSQTRSYGYDGMGRLTSSTTPEAGAVSLQYDTFDNLTQRTDARGVITTYGYDSLNRLAQVSYNVGTTGVPATPTVGFTYGTNQAQFNNGRLITMTDGVGSENYSYDLLGRTTQLQKVISGTTYTTSYAYNLASELASITYPSGRVVQQTFDVIGRLSKLNDANTTYANNLAYNAAQQLTGLLYGNGLCASLGYTSDRLQLTNLSYFSPSTSGNCQSAPNQTLFGLNYYYKTDSTNCPAGTSGNNGQIQCITDSVDSGRTVSYTYDTIGRLATAVTNGSTGYAKWGLSWTYDRYGNRTAQTVTSGSAPANSLTINATTNHVTGTGFAYDASGNMTNDGVNTLVYDAENRVTSSSGTGGSGTYTYDGNGLRVKKVSGSTTTVYLFSGAKVIAEYVNGAAPSSPTREYLYLGGALLASVKSGTVTYYHQDQLSNRLVTSSTGSATEQLGNYPFGESWYTATGEKWLFTSHERDSESGNDHAMARYYLNRFGRFLSTDPLSGSVADPQSLDRYSYVENDPINFADPSGFKMMPPLAWMGLQLFFGGVGFFDNMNEFDLMMIPTGPMSTDWEPSTLNYTQGQTQAVTSGLVGQDPTTGLSMSATYTVYGGPPDATLLDGTPVDQALNNSMRQVLRSRLRGFRQSNCAKVFAAALKGFSTKAFLAAAMADNFYFASRPPDSNYTQNQVVGNKDSTTLGNTLGYGGYAQTISGPSGTATILGENFFSDPAPSMGDNLFHEALHAYTRMDDTALFSAFGQFGLKPSSPYDTSAISNWLHNNCK